MKDTTDALKVPNGAPNPVQGWSRDILSLNDAIVVPPYEQRYMQNYGVWHDGRNIKEAALWRDDSCVTRPIHPDKAIAEDYLGGRHLWGGLYWGHPGSFIMESTNRFWAAKDTDVESILFVPRFPEMLKPGVIQTTIANIMGMDVPIRILQRPTQVKELLVPGQGVGVGTIAAGTPEYHAFREAYCEKINGQGPKKIYISRTKYGGNGGIISEKILEDNLKACGYEIYHPLDFNIHEQLARLKAAEKIISVDSTALHFLGLVAHRNQRLCIIARRNDEVVRRIALQHYGASRNMPQVVNALKADWSKSDKIGPNPNSWGEIDFDVLRQELVRSGFIPADANWRLPNQEEREGPIRRLKRQGFIEWPVEDRKDVSLEIYQGLIDELNSQTSKSPTDIIAAPVTIRKDTGFLGVCRFSMLGRGDWKAYRNLPEEDLEKVYAEKEKELFTPERMEMRLKTFEHITLASLKAQSHSDFRFFVASSDRMPEVYKNRLKALCDPVEQIILRFLPPTHITYAVRDLVSEQNIDLPNTLQFRMDDDDGLSTRAIETAWRHQRRNGALDDFAISFGTHYYWGTSKNCPARTAVA